MKTFKSIIAFCILNITFSANANAQIIYTTVNPNVTLYDSGRFSPTKNYDLDLNNDANNDFTITAYNYSTLGGSESRASATPLNGNAVKDTLVNSVYVSIPLQFNTVINSNLLSNQSWQTSGLNNMKRVVSFNPSTGLWDNLSDYYLGLKLLQSGQTYYGWVRLRVDATGSYASVILRDYAYNSIPNQPILAGQTIATGINENSFAASINIFPNPATNHFTIDLPKANEKVDITIADIRGKIIYTTAGSKMQKIEVNTEDFAKGIYVVQILREESFGQSADFIATKKLVIEK